MATKPQTLAVIMGGGRGTRLYPLTKERCKPAVPLGGKYRLVDIPISNCLNSGINRIFLLTQFHTASLHRHVQSTYKFDAFGAGFVDILSAEQTEQTSDWYQGTADAVRRNLVHFRNHAHDHVIILSGDQLYRMDCQNMIDQHIATNADVTIAAKPVPLSAVEGLGVMQVRDDLSIERFVEKPKDPAVIAGLALSAKIESALKAKVTEKQCLASMGIYVFKRSVLEAALNNTMTDFGKEVIPGLLGNMGLYAYIFEGYWEDIGTVRSFFEANLSLAHPLPQFDFFDSANPIYTHPRFLPPSKLNQCRMDHVVIGDGSIITNVSLKRCVIGVRSVIGDGASLEDVIMMGADTYEEADDIARNETLGRPDIGIGRDCHIRTAIIDKNTRIGDNVRLDPAGKPSGVIADGISIVDGILIISKGATVPSGTII
ncbi:MAG TPA: glucose-1-phosphate adenylyltransferase [Opitutaceae bacterium]|nr:glucose-1-phosphate adenylyltransferase [Opitutaceae bacterium]